MPLILIGIFILIVGLVVVPSIILLFTNPIAFGISLIAIGLVWVIFSKLFYGLIFAVVKTNETINEVILPKLKNKPLWGRFLKISNKVFTVVDSDLFKRIFAYGLIALGIVLVFYFEKNPLVDK